MLADDTYPTPGSPAMWDGHRVTIRQWNSDGSILIVGTGIFRRVEPDDLSPVSIDVLDRWAADRISVKGGDCFTSCGELLDDYRSWSDVTGLADFRIASQLTLSRMLAERGYARATLDVGMFRTLNLSGFAVQLRPLGASVAA